MCKVQFSHGQDCSLWSQLFSWPSLSFPCDGRIRSAHRDSLAIGSRVQKEQVKRKNKKKLGFSLSLFRNERRETCDKLLLLIESRLRSVTLNYPSFHAMELVKRESASFPIFFLSCFWKDNVGSSSLST